MLAQSLETKERTKDVTLLSSVSFSSLILPDNILYGLNKCGFQQPSPIQLKALPIGRCGFDLIVKSKSGTGKTLVFGIIALESLKLNKHSPQVLVVAPTREIAVQIQEVFKSIGTFYDDLSVECFIGGLPLDKDKSKLQCHIAVGTPGRLKQLIQSGFLPVDAVKIFILDEADKLTEESFQNDINEIYNALPERKQVIMCSATYPEEMQNFLSQYMLSPVVVSVELETPLLLGLKHYVRLLKSSPNVVQQTKVKNDELLKILSSVPFTQCLVFSNYQNRAESVSNFLNRNGWNSTFMSAAQKQTDRLSSLAGLKEFKLRILVTTDLTARGIDAPNIDLVINYDIPGEATTYLHRMGRAGRFGSTGTCINMAFLEEESTLLRHIVGIIGGEKLSMPVLDDQFHLDSKECDFLYGLVDDTIRNFKTYSSRINEMRSTLTEKPDPKEKSKKLKKQKNSSVNEQTTSILNQLASGDFEFQEGNTENQEELTAQDLLKQLAESGEVPLPVVKHSEPEEVFCKNKALFSTAKLLSEVSVSAEEVKDLSSYFTLLKGEVEPSEGTKPSEDFMENIFTLAYKCQISEDAPRWQTFIHEEDKAKLSADFQHVMEDEEVEEEDGDENYDYDFELEKDVEVNYSNNLDDYSFMKWVPVEPAQHSVQAQPETSAVIGAGAKRKTRNDVAYHSGFSTRPSYYEEYGRYFEHCNNSLWQNGLKFENAERFDEWFYDNWEEQLRTVRNFVQNKIYFEEMSKRN